VANGADLYGRAGTAWSIRLGGTHFHPGGEDGTVALAALAARQGFGNLPLIADIGCGIGGPARYLARRFCADVIGIDIAGPLLERAHQDARAEEAWLRCGFVRADALALPFADGSLPALWSLGTLSHIDQGVALAEIARVAAPGAQFALADWVAAGDPGEDARTAAREALGIRLLSLETYRDVLRRAGFSILAEEVEAPPEASPRASRDEHAWQTQFALRFGVGALHTELTRSRTWATALRAAQASTWRCVAARRAASSRFPVPSSQGINPGGG